MFQKENILITLLTNTKELFTLRKNVYERFWTLAIETDLEMKTIIIVFCNIEQN